MDWATERGHAEVVRFLRGGDEAGASEAAVDPDALWRAASQGDEAEGRWLLRPRQRVRIRLGADLG